jgi:hypothetical protein
MSAVDTTPFSAPSEPRRGRPVPIDGSGAQVLWSSHSLSMAEVASYAVGEQELPWRWERIEGGWTATDRVTGIFGFGEDVNGAIVDLLHALKEHREVLEAQDELSPDLQEQLAYLQRP